MVLDHLILKVNDVAKSLRFYTEVLGLSFEGEDPPFSILRVNDELTIQLAPFGTGGGEHLAFSLSRSGFDEVWKRIRERDLPFGDSFDGVGNGKGPGRERGARGEGASLYFFDPDRHLIEIRHYE